MIRVIFDHNLQAEYQTLFKTCQIKPHFDHVAKDIADKIAKNKSRYAVIAAQVGCPWYVVGLIHNEECGLSFEKHLHNGDPLTAKTVHVPKGRPLTGTPPFLFEASALDALRLRGFDRWHDWSIAGILWQLEQYNGLGYRQYHPGVLSPYLWSGTNHYVKGKYVADGKFSAAAVSKQLGVAALLKHLV